MLIRGIFLSLILTILLFSCQQSDSKKTIDLVYFEWDSSTISAEIVKIILERKLGYQVRMTSTFPSAGWASVGVGMSDICVSGWLPDTHKAFYSNLSNRVEVLGKCTKNLYTGLAVPSYVTCNSISDLKDSIHCFDGTIHGIDPGAGIMVVLESAVKEYDLDKFTIQEGSEVVMLAAVDEAIKSSKWIVFTAWTPHPIFQIYDIKFLQDNKKIFGEEEYATFITRKNLNKDFPDVHALLKQLTIDKSELEAMQYKLRVLKTSAEVLAENWVNEHNKEIDLLLEDTITCSSQNK